MAGGVDSDDQIHYSRNDVYFTIGLTVFVVLVIALLVLIIVDFICSLPRFKEPVDTVKVAKVDTRSS